MIYIYLFILGLAIGSFLNVLIDRLPNEQSIDGRSHCDYCHQKLTVWDLIPVLSFIFLGAKCRYCHKKLSFFYPLVELVTAVLFVITWIYIPIGIHIAKLAYLGITACMIVIFFADLKYQIIPDSVQIGLFVFSLFAISQNITPLIFFNRAAASLLVMAPILFLFLLTQGKGMGFGDVKLAFTIGFLFGLEGGLIAIYLAFISGALIGLILIFAGRKRLKSKIAFGPFLVIGMSMMLFWQEQIFILIKKLYGL